MLVDAVQVLHRDVAGAIRDIGSSIRFRSKSRIGARVRLCPAYDLQHPAGFRALVR